MRLRANTRQAALAPTLPMPYPQLAAAQVRMRRGQTSLWIAASGVGKSTVLNNLAQRMGVPTMYWSADTDHNDVLLRTVALWSGTTTDEVEQQLHEPAWRAYHDKHMQSAAHIDWIFDAAITPPLVGERIKAFAELHGEYPHLAVIDNLSNTVQDQDDKWSEQEAVMVAMQRLARETQAHIAVLAHVKGEYEGGMKPIPKSGSLNNMFRTVELGVTLHQASDDGTRLGLNAVKNRSGKPDPAAKNAIVLEADFSRATIRGWRTTQVAA